MDMGSMERPKRWDGQERSDQPKPGTDHSHMFLTAEAIWHSRSSSEIKGLLHFNLFLLVADGIPFSVNNEKNRPALFPRHVTEDFSPVLEIHGAGTGSRHGAQRAATTSSVRFLFTGDKDFSDRGHTENLALPVQKRRHCTRLKGVRET
jgi:hypothetical protein